MGGAQGEQGRTSLAHLVTVVLRLPPCRFLLSYLNAAFSTPFTSTSRARALKAVSTARVTVPPTRSPGESTRLLICNSTVAARSCSDSLDIGADERTDERRTDGSATHTDGCRLSTRSSEASCNARPCRGSSTLIGSTGSAPALRCERNPRHGGSRILRGGGAEEIDAHSGAF